MKQQTPSEYVHNKSMRTNTLFRVINNVGHYILKGHLFTKEEFESMYPFAEAVRQLGDFHKQDIVKYRP